jgi:hypothetical protein
MRPDRPHHLLDPNFSEARMIITNYTTEDLKRLPLRSIVALAARCARRVEHLALLPEGHPARERCRSAVANAIQLAEDFARAEPCPSYESVVREVEACRAIEDGAVLRDCAMAAAVRAAHAAVCALQALELREEPGESRLMSTPPPNPFAHLADITADLAARDAFMAAIEAADAIGYTDRFVHEATEDAQELLKLNLGSYPQAGQPIDPSPHGPLGPLGPEESSD